MVDAHSLKVTVVGKLNDAKFQRVKKAVEFMGRSVDGLVYEVKALVPTDYENYVADKIPRMEPKQVHKDNVLVLVDDPKPDTYIGGETAFLQWAGEEFGYNDSGTNTLLYQRMAKKHMQAYMKSTGRTYVRMTLADPQEVIGIMTLELYDDKCPRTVKHFCKHVTDAAGALTYSGSPIHRVVPGAFIQGGDLEAGRGDGVPDTFLPDETFITKHDAAGILALANVENRPHSNGTQFYITLAPLPWLDGKKVAFGRVLDGMRTVKVIAKAKCKNERPVNAIRIRNAELLTI